MTKTNNKSTRVKYGFELKFPQSFTLRDLFKAKHNKVKYITLHSRVRKAIENGTVVEDGLKNPNKTRRGRKEKMYRLVVAPPSAITVDTATPTPVSW